MWEFIKAGGPVMFFLILTSIAGATIIIERGLALRWKKVIPTDVEEAVDRCGMKDGLTMVESTIRAHPSPISRLLLLAKEHLDWPKQGEFRRNRNTGPP